MTLKSYGEKIKNRNPEVVQRLQQDLAFQISLEIERIRIESGVTQLELAQKINTYQSSIARLESGLKLPSLRFLKKIADKLDYYIEVKFRKVNVAGDPDAYVPRHNLLYNVRCNGNVYFCSLPGSSSLYGETYESAPIQASINYHAPTETHMQGLLEIA